MAVHLKITPASESFEPEEPHTHDVQPDIEAPVVPSSSEAMTSTSPSENMIAMNAIVATDQIAEFENGEGAEMDPSYIYTIGMIDARFPNMSLEKEFDHVANLPTTSDPPARQKLYDTLTANNYANLYIARDLCWIFAVDNLDSYILIPRSDEVLKQLIDMLKPVQTNNLSVKDGDFHVVIGSLGPSAPPDMCNGVQLPIAFINHTYFFQGSTHVDQVQKKLHEEDPNAGQVSQQQLAELLTTLTQLSDHLGGLNERRARL